MREKIREAIAYKERGYLDLAREIFEEISDRIKDSLAFFHQGELYLKIARRKRGEISPLQYKAILEKARKYFQYCIKKDRGELYRFQDSKGNIKYLTLSTLAQDRVYVIQEEIRNLRGIKEREELIRVGPLHWSEGTLLVVKPSSKEKK